MKVQVCKFRRSKGNAVFKQDVVWEDGLAFVSEGFNCGFASVDFIVDTKGDRLYDVHVWRLKEGPLCYIDTDYTER